MIVLWRVTERCNLACGFCAYDRRLPGPRREADVAVVLRMGALLADYRRTTGERVLLSWLGGEPLLWRPVFDVSRRLRHEHGIELSATTNGSSLHRIDTLQGVLDAFCELTLSVDGLAEFHDRVRGNAGAWLRLRHAARALVQARDERGAALKLRVNIVLMRDNLHQFPDLCAELVDWGIDEITFNQLGGRDRPEFFPAHSLRPHDVVSLRVQLPGLRQALAARGVRLCAGDAYLQRIESSARREAIAVADCAPGERFLFIDEMGRVAPCSFTADSLGVPIETLQDVRSLIDLPSIYRLAQREQQATACNDCHATHVFAKFHA